jgi:hypothetical protein
VIVVTLVSMLVCLLQAIALALGVQEPWANCLP